MEEYVSTLSIEGHCTRQTVLEADEALMFTYEGRTYAVINGSACGRVWMLLLVLSDEEYRDWNAILRPTRVDEV